MAKEKFYMCYVEGGDSPTYKHFTLEGATTEAKRLADVSGKEVYILEALTCVKLNKYIIENCKETTDNPFKFQNYEQINETKCSSTETSHRRGEEITDHEGIHAEESSPC